MWASDAFSLPEFACRRHFRATSSSHAHECGGIACLSSGYTARLQIIQEPEDPHAVDQIGVGQQHLVVAGKLLELFADRQAYLKS